MHTLLAQLQTKRVGKALQGIPGVVKCEKRLVVEGRDLYYPVHNQFHAKQIELIYIDVGNG